MVFSPLVGLSGVRMSDSIFVQPFSRDQLCSETSCGGRHPPFGASSKNQTLMPAMRRATPKSTAYQSSRLLLDQHVHLFSGRNGLVRGFWTLSIVNVNEADAVTLRTAPSM